MKFILKRDDEVKLFTEELVYGTLTSFIEREFNLQSPTIEITFTDEDGDKIMIASDEDISIVESYFTGKQYVKLDVKGQEKLNALMKDDAVQIKNDQNQQLIYPVKKTKKDKKIKNQQKEEKPKENLKNDKVKKDNVKKGSNKASEIKKLLNLAVTQLVDKRLKAMIPCLKEQLCQDKKIKRTHGKEVIHQRYECSICLRKPIVGVRYECPTCQTFNVCSSCEETSLHEHNLLKIRYLNEENIKQEENYIDKLCKLILDGQQKPKQKKSAETIKKEKQIKELQKEKLKQTKKYLSQLFGNEPKFYNDFVKRNKKLSIEEIVKLYSKGVSIPDEQLYDKVVQLQCHRLQKKFNKPSNSYINFVKENFDFDFHTVLSSLYEKGVQKQETISAIAKNPSQEGVEESQKIVHDQKQKSHLMQEKQEVKIEKLESDIIQKKEQQKEEVVQFKGKKKEILNLMADFFGDAKRKQYIKFIQQNQKYSKQDIVQMWADRYSILEP